MGASGLLFPGAAQTPGISAIPAGIQAASAMGAMPGTIAQELSLPTPGYGPGMALGAAVNPESFGGMGSNLMGQGGIFGDPAELMARYQIMGNMGFDPLGLQEPEPYMPLAAPPPMMPVGPIQAPNLAGALSASLPRGMY